MLVVKKGLSKPTPLKLGNNHHNLQGRSTCGSSLALYHTERLPLGWLIFENKCMSLLHFLAAASLVTASTSAVVGSGEVVVLSGTTAASGVSLDPAPEFGITQTGVVVASGSTETGVALPFVASGVNTSANNPSVPQPVLLTPKAAPTPLKTTVVPATTTVPVPTLTHYLNLKDSNKEVFALQSYLQSLGFFDEATGSAYDERLGKAINAYLLTKTKTVWTDLEVTGKKYLALVKVLKEEKAAQRWNSYKAKRDALYREIDALNKRRAANFQANKATFKAIDDERKALVIEYARKFAENKAKFQAALKNQTVTKTNSTKEYNEILAKIRVLDVNYRAGK